MPPCHWPLTSSISTSSAAALAEGEVQHAAVQRTPLVPGRPDLAAAGIVHETRNPAQRLVIAERTLVGDFRALVAEVTSFAGHGDVRDWRPFPFLRGGGDHALRTDAEAVRIAQAGGDDGGVAAGGWNAQDTVDAVHEVEVSLRIGFETGDVIVAAGGCEISAGEVLIEVRFAVVVQIVQPRDLVAAEDVDLIVDDLHAQRLKQAGRKALPRDGVQVGVEAVQEPDIAMDGAARPRGRR